MKTEHVYSKHHTRQMRVNELTVRVSRLGGVIATITREDGRSLQLSMSQAEAHSFAEKLTGPETPAPESLERDARLLSHDAIVETPHGVASLQYLGDGRYRVADGAAIVARHHSGRYWTVEGSGAKHATRHDAVTHIMERL